MVEDLICLLAQRRSNMVQTSAQVLTLPFLLDTTLSLLTVRRYIVSVSGG